ncbi:MAG: hypothetical protein DRJ51_06870 [Thermoprotei archaeon]|nr:MAG: hypothetical protein DRJ51_06870 [Thermoprotei archaeon]
MSLFSKKDKFEELERSISERMAGLEDSLSSKLDECLSRIEDKLVNLLNLTQEVAAQPERIESRLGAFINSAEKVADKLVIVNDYANMLRSLREGIYDIVNSLSKEREEIRRQIEALKRERDELMMMREEIKKWREELEKKERELNLREAELGDLENRKIELEGKINELSERYLKGLEELKNKFEEMARGILRDFRIREIRLERLVRREAELKDAIAKLREKEMEAEKLEKEVARLRGELNVLSERKRRLEAEIKELEERRGNLERILADMRRAFLSP